MSRSASPRYRAWKLGIPWAFLVFNLGLCLVLFWSVLFGNQQFCFRDEAHFYYPVYHYIQTELEAGRFPLWTPYENIGQPFFANAALGILYPGKLIFFLPFDYFILYNIFLTGHVFLASLTLYRLARHWGISPWGATLGSLAYGFAGTVFGQYCNPIFLIGAAWVPEAVLWADRTLTRRSWRCAVICAAVLSVMLLGGDPQAAFHAGLVASLLALFRWRREHVLLKTAGPVLRDFPPTPFFSVQQMAGLYRNRLFLLAVIAGTTFLFSAVQILPSSEFSKLCDRAGYKTPRSVWEIPAFLLADEKDTIKDEIFFNETAISAEKSVDIGHLSRQQRIFSGIFQYRYTDPHQSNTYHFSSHPAQYFSFLWSNVTGRHFPQNTAWFTYIFRYLKSPDWHLTFYAGIVPFLLAVLSLQFRFTIRNNIRIVWLSWFLLISLLGGLGYYGLGWFLTSCLGVPMAQNPVAFPVGGVFWLMQTFIPGYIQFRYSPKLLTLAACPMAMLAAYGFDRLILSLSQKTDSERLLLLFRRIALGLIVISLFLFLPVSMQNEWNNLAMKTAPRETVGPFIPDLTGKQVLQSLFQTAAVLLMILCLIRWRNKFSLPILLTLFVTVVSIDLYFSCHSMLFTTDRAVFLKNKPAFLDAFEPAKRIEPTRIMLRVDLPAHWKTDSSPERMAEFRLNERRLMQIQFLYDAPRNEFGYLPVAKAMESGTMSPYTYAWWIAKNIQDDYHFEKNLMFVGIEYALMDISKPLDSNLATMLVRPGQADTPADWAENVVLWKLKNPCDRTWIEGENRENRENRKSDREFSRITHYEPNRVVIEAKLAEPGTVVLSDQFFPGWRLDIETLSDDGGETLPAAAGTIRPVNEFFRGVDLSDGHFRLTYNYDPDSFRYGAILSGISWTAFLLFTIISGRIGRRTSLLFLLFRQK